MKLTLLICLTAILFIPAQDDDNKVDCVITAVDSDVSIACDTPSRLPECLGNETAERCAHALISIPLVEWSSWPHWGETKPQLRQLLKAQWTEDGRFEPIGTCEQRTQVAMDNFLRLCGYGCRAPINSLTPADCRRPQSEFIRGLLGVKLTRR